MTSSFGQDLGKYKNQTDVVISFEVTANGRRTDRQTGKWVHSKTQTATVSYEPRMVVEGQGHFAQLL